MCVEVAFLLKDILSRLALEAFPKVSGSKGIQLYVPLNSHTQYTVTQPFARAVAELLASQHLKLIVAKMANSERKKKVFIDWSQNADFKTTVGGKRLRNPH
jgi:bifunctional non-homologous end joining protein LigD